MPELRWTLLILGALFIVALTLWELRRQRHARGQKIAQRASEGERLAPTFDESADAARAPVQEGARGDLRVFREPTLTFPDSPAEPVREERASISRPPVVELDDASIAGLKVEQHKVVDEFSTPAPGPAAESESISALPDDTGVDDEIEEIAHEPEPAAAASLADDDTWAVTEPIVEWPDEDVRKIVALRLVAPTGDRFPGRAVRQALASEGFVLGKFEIFHKPGPDGRAVLSAASLTKPGTFSLATMDAQRLGGLSLFAVLPGPLPPVATFDELLLTARSLNDRLRGALQDERGEPLTPTRSASIREGLAAAATGAAPA